MGDVTPIPRRLILRQFASGGAVLCTFLGAPWGAGAGGLARAASPHGPLTKAAGARPPLILLDPGHGGRDPGATGATGTLEKHVTLASALVLKATLEARGAYRVELTRAKDRFVAPEDRADLARERGASLFLSLHADTLPDPSVRGAAVYTLAKRASDPETEALANRENGLPPGSGTAMAGIAPEVSDILTSLATRENRAASSRAARQMISDLERDIQVLPSPRRQANFIVLQAVGIPSVLIEMGFLSNPADEAALNDPGYRDKIARSVTRAIDAWFGQAQPGRASAAGSG